MKAVRLLLEISTAKYEMHSLFWIKGILRTLEYYKNSFFFMFRLVLLVLTVDILSLTNLQPKCIVSTNLCTVNLDAQYYFKPQRSISLFLHFYREVNVCSQQ